MIGLTDIEVQSNRKKYGSNTYTKLKRKSFFKLVLETLSDPIIKILLIVLIIKIIFLFRDFDWFETIGILVAILSSSIISAISEYGSDSAFENLENTTSNIKVKVIRENQIREIDSVDVVKDDIIILSSGDKIVADGIIIQGEVLVNESTINGEAKEKKKIKDDFIYSSTIVFDGEAKMKVSAVGDNTIIGKMAKDIQEDSPISPLKIRLTQLARIISILGYIGALFVFIVYLFTSKDYSFSNILYALTLSVTVVVVSVPEGLPMMITLVLSSNMKKMMKNNVLVRKLVGIETSGNLNILLTDKTGTLTEGKLNVYKIVTYEKEYNNLEQLNNNLKNEVNNNILYNNSSMINSNGNAIGGNSTDRALLSFANFDNSRKVIYKEIFDSNKKYSLATLDNDITYIKGASEVLLDKCNYYLDANGDKKVLYSKNKIEDKIDSYSKLGVRVLMLCSSLDYINTKSINNLTFIGLILIKDKIRESSKDAINLMNQAKIQTIMVTGDALNTAVSIAKETNIISDSKDIAIDSSEFSKLSDEEIVNIYPHLKVLARALPQDKSRLVNILEQENLIVGMCGDGVNDAVALKKANVGFAIGSGSEVAKEASDIVILDDNIKSITNAVLYGRTIFKSIRKFIIFQLTVNLSAMIMAIVGPIINIATPVTIIQMLWINMIMDTLAGVAFSYEAPLLEYMQEKPKTNKTKIINKYMYKQILFMGMYSAVVGILFLKLPLFRFLIRNEEKYILTAYFALFIFMGIFNAFNARTPRLNIFANILKNKVFIVIFSIILIIQIYLIYYGKDLFRTYGLTFNELVFVILVSISVIPINFFIKLKSKKRLESI
ncbi:MAG: calcium-translocating P-type ATPase, PMCA-type [Bacilli bacterium]|nr:calcium-translocating P-type ATPase, PMCA-type [Bacilli bacterium]